MSWGIKLTIIVDGQSVTRTYACSQILSVQEACSERSTNAIVEFVTGHRLRVVQTAKDILTHLENCKDGL